MVKIFIDPGHGGNDPGAVGNGLKEKDLTLKIAKKIKSKLTNYENVQVKLSREGDQTLSLKQRTDMANQWGADYVISVHINSASGTNGTGFESFIYNGSVGQKTIASQNVIHPEIVKATGFKDRGKKRANFHMVRATKASAILTENGFINNPADANKLKQDSFLEKIAQGHVNGLVKVYGLKSKQNIVNIYTGGYRGTGLAKIHEFLLYNNFWYKPTRLSDGTMSFLVGGFTVGGETYNKMKKFLDENKYYYEIRQ
jgi:N-acetylmuramoyl-L-alanine amidase